MYCRYCGKKIPDDAIFCQYCGENVTEESMENYSQNSEYNAYEDSEYDTYEDSEYDTYETDRQRRKEDHTIDYFNMRYWEEILGVVVVVLILIFAGIVGISGLLFK